MTEGKSEGAKSIKIHWEEDMPTVHPTHLVAQHDQHEFTLSFFRVHPPILMGTAEDKTAQLEALDKVRASGLVRLVVPASRMAEFIKVLEANYQTFEESRAEAERTGVEK